MAHKFFRKETGKYEEVAEQRWRWIAVFDDGSILHQYGEDGIFHQFAEIDQAHLIRFHMVSGEGKTKTLMFEPGMKLIHFYRQLMLEDGAIRVTIYVFGYQRGSEKVLLVIMPNDDTILTDDVDKITIVLGE